MSETDLMAVVRDYLAAMENRDMEACLAFFTDDAEIDFQEGRFVGQEGVREWHEDRFLADLRLLEIEEMRREETDRVEVDVVVASEALRVWRMDRLAGTVTFAFRGDKIQEATFGLRMYNEGLWQV